MSEVHAGGPLGLPFNDWEKPTGAAQKTSPEALTKAQKLLGTLESAGATPAPSLSFSQKSTAAQSKLSPVNISSTKSASGKIQTGSATLSGVAAKEALKPSNDVRKLSQEKFNEVKTSMEKYSQLQKGGSGLMSSWTPETPDWAPLRSGEDEKALSRRDLPEDTKKLFLQLKSELSDIGFLPADGNTDKGFYHKESGSRIAVMCSRDGKELSIFIQGLQDPKAKGFFPRLKQVLSESVGGKPPSTDLCLKMGKVLEKLKNENSNKTFSVVGHSHGGNLAQIVALTAGIKGVCFNSRCISGKTQDLIGKENIAQNAGNITHFNKEGDWLTGTRAIRGLATVWAKITGSAKAERFGTQFSLPPNEGVKGSLNIHNDTSWPSGLKCESPPATPTAIKHQSNLTTLVSDKDPLETQTYTNRTMDNLEMTEHLYRLPPQLQKTAPKETIVLDDEPNEDNLIY